MRNFLNFKTSWTILLAIVLTLASCDKAEDGTGIEGNFNLEGEPVTVTVTVHETQSALRAAYKDHFGAALVEQGFAVATFDRVNGHHCEIHVVAIRSVTDNTRINTWGHEYAHCIYGLWHE